VKRNERHKKYVLKCMQLTVAECTLFEQYGLVWCATTRNKTMLVYSHNRKRIRHRVPFIARRAMTQTYMNPTLDSNAIWVRNTRWKENWAMILAGEQTTDFMLLDHVIEPPTPKVLTAVAAVHARSRGIKHRALGCGICSEAHLITSDET